MKKMLIAAAAVVLSAQAAVSHAAPVESGFYVGGGYNFVTYSESGAPDADLGALFIRGGYQLNDYIALEARLGTGVQDDDVSLYGYRVNVELENYYGAYFKAGIPTEIGLYPYVLLGVTHAEVKASLGGYSISDDGSDVSYGVGVDYLFNQQVSVGLEYANFYDKDGVEITGFTLGLNYKF